MISEQQCITSVNYLISIGSDNIDCFHEIIALSKKLKSAVSNGNKNEVDIICRNIYNYDYQSDMERAMLIYALADASVYSDMKKLFLEKAIRLSDDLLKKSEELGSDESAALASGLMMLEISRIPVVLKHVYISCARKLTAASSQNIDTLSSDGTFFLLNALNALIKARRVYKW